VREAVGDEVELLVDANTGYTLEDVRRVMPAYDELDIGWLEEPFPAYDRQPYQAAARLGRPPLAAGENHYTRYEFARLIEDKAVGILQPDASKAGGITELMRIAALGSAWRLPLCPHTCATGLNMASSIHVLASIDNGGYFEADTAKENLFRDRLTRRADSLDENGCVSPSDEPGLGVAVDEEFLRAHPVIEGPAYV